MKFEAQPTYGTPIPYCQSNHLIILLLQAEMEKKLHVQTA